MRKILPTLLLCMALVALGAWSVLSTRRAALAEHTLNETWLAALGESAELMESLSLSMEKALLSRDPSQTAALLSQVGRDAGDIRRALAFLPLDAEIITPAMTLAERIAEGAVQWLPDLVDDGALSAASRESLSALLTECTLLSGEMALARQEVLSGARSFTDAPATSSPAAPALPLTQLPTAKGLPMTETTVGQAMTLARAFVGEDRVTSLEQAPDLLGPIAAWGVAVGTNDVTLNVYVTQIGGKVLMMAPETASFPELLTVDACRAAADEFLASRGFAAMESDYHQVYGGLCVLSYAPVQEGVVIYPDRLTVQVRMDTGEVVGLEASAYWQNHTPRRIPQPALTAQEARQRLASDALEQGSRLCLYPESDRETLCWEFSVTWQGEPFLIYIDASSGREVALQKLILLENGVMAA